MSVSLSGTLHCQECSWIPTRRLQPSIGILQDIWKCRNSVSCQISEASVLLTNYSWERLEWSIGLFQVLWGYKWKYLSLGPWTCRTVCKMKVEGSGAHLQSSFRICSQTNFSYVASKGSGGSHNQEGLELGHEPHQGPQPGPKSGGLLPKGQADVTFWDLWHMILVVVQRRIETVVTSVGVQCCLGSVTGCSW